MSFFQKTEHLSCDKTDGTRLNVDFSILGMFPIADKTL